MTDLSAVTARDCSEEQKEITKTISEVMLETGNEGWVQSSEKGVEMCLDPEATDQTILRVRGKFKSYIKLPTTVDYLFLNDGILIIGTPNIPHELSPHFDNTKFPPQQQTYKIGAGQCITICGETQHKFEPEHPIGHSLFLIAKDIEGRRNPYIPPSPILDEDY
ncbi:hypothetical protein HOD83_03270 [Candidatus Woesearchaeota archaeon]|jgi:hypothetical protein|nr:hypothetical protein [Candidatus Woesearchaeota archaeon]MBT4114405.1 hypothetical protein [Candidatus Woesearchaeota archaeon]MBT4248579.1 hypothetical protein [Candidatus Woesearchaeota archaeon]